MGSLRFFVANLPPSTKEQQLTEIFQDYGTVERVELKSKENPFEPECAKVIAFVTLQIHQSEVNNCVEALNWQNINGTQIKVSLAKESFLERLKREREEAEKGKSGDSQPTWSEEQTEAVLPCNAENTRKTFTEEELTALENDDDIAADLLISKKRASNSMYNGRIVIQSFDTKPLHIIEGTKKKKKKPDGSESLAEQKRKKSQNNMTKKYKENKSIIQQALSGQDASKSNKIKFSYAEEEEEQSANIYDSEHKLTTNIFGSEDDDDAENIGELQLKPELFGKKGVKLLEMQSKQSLDPRFRIDAKFVDEEEDEQAEAASNANEATENVENERSWQMGILEQVVGTKFDMADSAQKAARKKRMLRYDPSKEEHKKLLRTVNKETPLDAGTASLVTSEKKQKKLQTEGEELTGTNAAPEVSKEVFYVVTDTLAESLKTRGDGFSLLNMFGSAQLQDKRADELKKVSDSKILVNKLDKNALNPFKYDSSSDEEGENQAMLNSAEAPQKSKKEKQQNKILLESFFIPRNDARLKEGTKFFRFVKKDEPEENYEAVRNRLKLLIRSKINKTKKNLVASSGGGGEGHKKRVKVRH